MPDRIAPRLSICVAGNARIAIDAVRAARALAPGVPCYAVPNADDDGVDHWQPSLRRYLARTGDATVISLLEAGGLHRSLVLSVGYDGPTDRATFGIDAVLAVLGFPDGSAFAGLESVRRLILRGPVVTDCILTAVDGRCGTAWTKGRASLRIEPGDTVRTVYRRYAGAGAKLIASQLPSLMAGRIASVEHAPGPIVIGTDTAPHDNAAGHTIDLTRSAAAVVRQVAASQDREAGLPRILGKPIAQARPRGKRSGKPPGTILDETCHWVSVATADDDCLLISDEFDDLMNAVRSGDASEVTAICQRNPALLGEADANGWTPLIVAAYAGNAASVEILLALGAAVDQPNEKGTTPLMYAKDAFLRTGDGTVLRLLCAHGADRDARDMYGLTLLDYVPAIDRAAVDAALA